MKIVFFRQLLMDGVTQQWSAAQQIVYSHLLSQSILKIGCVFNKEGTNIDYEKVIEEHCDEYSQIDLVDYKVQQLSDLLCVSKQNVYDSIAFLRMIHYISGDLIYCPPEIISHGYFELKMDSGLTKHLLIFYSWLYERSQQCGGMISSFSYKLADKFGTNESNIRAMLSRLADRGLVKRIKTEDKRYGKLIIK